MDNKARDIKDFVYYMIHSKNLTQKQQARRDLLFTRDSISPDSSTAENEEISISNLKEDFQTEKDAKSASGNSLLVNSHKSKKVKKFDLDQVEYISPKNLQTFLYRFNQDSVLKYTCHEIDTDETIKEICNLCGTEDYSLKKHSDLIFKSFIKLKNGLKKDNIHTDRNMYGLISVYLAGKIIGKNTKPQTQWSSLNIDINWASLELLKWGEDNPGIIPSPGKNIVRKQGNKGFELPKALKSNITGNRILAFKELVLYFKSLFHIRRDNSLRDILCYVNKTEEYGNDNINIVFVESSFPANIEILTDVDKLVQTYKKIIRICRSCHKEEDCLSIELSLYEKEGYVYFCIHDVNSVYGKSLDAASKRIGESQTDLIINQVNGLCDLFIEADFGNQEYARIALWNENSNPLGEMPNIDVIKIDKCTGVKYILRF